MMRRQLLVALVVLLPCARAHAQVVVSPPQPQPKPKVELPKFLPDFRYRFAAPQIDIADVAVRVTPPNVVWRGDIRFGAAQTWYRDDPADSLYRVAHSLFSRQEYRAAANGYAAVRTRYPDSKYYCDAAYYEAFARYRLGTTADLRTAHAVLDGAQSRCSDGARRADVPALLSRIDGALARQGDAAAAERVRRAASQGLRVCDREEQNVKTEALSALMQIDPQAAAPVLRSALNTTDECMAPVRRHALSIVARDNGSESVTLLGTVAKNDPDQGNRLEAVRVLGRMSNDAAFAALEDVMRTTSDERIQTEVVSTLGRHDSPRAQAAVRALIERRDVSERNRLTAINTLATRKDVTVEYWRGVYGRVESEALRRAVISAVARNNGAESQQLLLSIARNTNESPAVRQAAITRVQTTAPVNEVYRLLETADSRSVRLAIVSAIAARKEPEATDRLIDVAKTSTDPEVRAAAIRALGRSPRKEDPKVIKALGEIVCCER